MKSEGPCVFSVAVAMTASDCCAEALEPLVAAGTATRDGLTEFL